MLSVDSRAMPRKPLPIPRYKSDVMTREPLRLVIRVPAFSVRKHRDQRRKGLRASPHILRNVRELVSSPLERWDLEGRRQYFDRSRQVIDGLRGEYVQREHAFDEVFLPRPEQ